MGQFKNYIYDIEYIIKQADPCAVIVWDYMDLDDLHSMAASTGSKLARYLLYAHELISDALSDAADDTIMFYGLDEQAQALALTHLDTWTRGDLTDGHYLVAYLASLMGAPEVSP